MAGGANVASENDPEVGTLVTDRVCTSDGSTVACNDDELVWDSSNSRLGIGTATPTKLLHVDAGSTADDGFLLSHSSGTVSSKWTVTNPGTNNDVLFGAVSNNGLNLITNDTTRLSILNSGNVGIGALSPQSKLDVRDGNISSVNEDKWSGFYSDTHGSNQNWWAGLYIRNSRGTAAAPSATQSGDTLGIVRWLGYGTTGWPLGSASAEIQAKAEGTFTDTSIPTSLLFKTAGATGVASERVRITPEGNVGIGTTSPQSKLDLGGGNIKMGHEVITNAIGKSGTADCPAGKQLLSGGCGCHPSGGNVMSSYPYSTSRWYCECSTTSSNIAHALCANIK